MINKCLIYSYLSLCNLFEINSIIRYYSNYYDVVYVVSKDNYYTSAFNIFSDNKKIITLCIKIDTMTIPNNHYIFDLYKDSTIINLSLNDDLNSFAKNYYNNINLDYNLKSIYNKINRNNFFEEKFYNKVMKKYIFINNYEDNNLKKYNKYIFINDYQNNESKKINIYSDYPIYHPEINYYINNKNSIFYDYWINEKSDNILDYCKIMENAHELHLVYNDFFCLSLFLNLENVKNKYIYTDIINIKDYYDIKDWKIIYINC
jgi:hypothetical protein